VAIDGAKDGALSDATGVQPRPKRGDRAGFTAGGDHADNLPGGLLCLGWVVLHFLGERLVFLRQFDQPGAGLLVGNVGSEGSVTSGAGEQIGGVIHPPPTGTYRLNKLAY
jgi:hypothetical protein